VEHLLPPSTTAANTIAQLLLTILLVIHLLAVRMREARTWTRLIVMTATGDIATVGV